MTYENYRLQARYGYAYLPPPEPPKRVYQHIRVMGKSYDVPTNRWRIGFVEYWYD